MHCVETKRKKERSIVRWDDANTFRTVLRIRGWDGEFAAFFVFSLYIHEKNDFYRIRVFHEKCVDHSYP